MSTIKMDLNTAKWVADKAQNDLSVFPVEFDICNKCGAAFLPELGHDCGNVIELDAKTKEDARLEWEGS